MLTVFAFLCWLQVSDSFSLQCVSALVLDEDGTDVETEEFFQTLPENTVLMVLEKGQKWSVHPVRLLFTVTATRWRSSAVYPWPQNATCLFGREMLDVEYLTSFMHVGYLT